MEKPDKDYDPVQFHYNQFWENPHDPFLHKKVYLTLSITDKIDNEDVIKTISTELITDGKGQEEQSEVEKNKLEIIFSLFNPILTQSSNESYYIAAPLENKMSSYRPSLFETSNSDQTLLYCCIYALSIGEKLKREE